MAEKFCVQQHSSILEKGLFVCVENLFLLFLLSESCFSTLILEHCHIKCLYCNSTCSTNLVLRDLPKFLFLFSDIRECCLNSLSTHCTGRGLQFSKWYSLILSKTHFFYLHRLHPKKPGGHFCSRTTPT